jgi:cysteine-rich repeat protein
MSIFLPALGIILTLRASLLLLAFCSTESHRDPIPPEDQVLTGVPAMPICGDGIIDPCEECDDGNANPGDGCFNCQYE